MIKTQVVDIITLLTQQLVTVKNLVRGSWDNKYYSALWTHSGAQDIPPPPLW